MWTIIIFIAIFAIIFYNQQKDYCDNFFEHFLMLVLGSMFGFMIGLIIALALPEKTEMIKETTVLEVDPEFDTFQLLSLMLESKTIDYKDVEIIYNTPDSLVRVELIEERTVKDAFINYFAIDFPDNYERKVIYYIPTKFIKN